MCTSENAYFGSEHQSSYGNVPVINNSARITNGKGKVPSPTSFPSDLQPRSFGFDFQQSPKLSIPLNLVFLCSLLQKFLLPHVISYNYVYAEFEVEC
ncbi:hypothetical protein GJ496_007660 [Pomphorhynchus laevis]|nr:hypothetical protein GJ496_007660 [Pomphorhynchus laevis]